MQASLVESTIVKKNRLRRWVPWAVTLGAMSLFPALSIGHEDKDPVCGMSVEIEKASEKMLYAGKNYIFCGPVCLEAFRASPDKYASALRLIEYRGKTALAFTLRPRLPKPGELAKFYIQAGPAASEEMGPDPKTLRKVAEGKAYLYPADRSREARPEVFRLHETAEPRTYGFSKLIGAEGVYRVYFVLRYEGGEESRIAFDCVTEGAVPKDDYHHEGPATAGVPASAPPKGEVHKPAGNSAHGQAKLTMEVQHETMRRMGELWASSGDRLFSEPADLPQAKKHLSDIESWRKNMPEFVLHKFNGQKAEYLRYSDELETRLRGMNDLLSKGDVEGSRARFVEIEGQSCVKCHLKFRWAAVDDLSRFPDLRRSEHGPR
jgi:YHS domain-containing protein